MKPLRIDQDAEGELRAAISRYEDERPGLGDEFWSEVQHALQMIAEHPDIGGQVQRVRVRGTAHRFPVRRFPFFVIYRDHPDDIEIVAFAHQSRRPGYWRKRGS